MNTTILKEVLYELAFAAFETAGILLIGVFMFATYLHATNQIGI